MTRFNETKVDSASGTVEIGAGLTWDKVYVALEPTGVNVVGGRNPGLGVSGLTLGGGGCLFFIRGLRSSDPRTCIAGYSYKSSQYGLTIDTVTGYELVLPNGTVIIVTPNDEDLWFGLRVSRASLSSILIGIAKSPMTGWTQ